MSFEIHLDNEKNYDALNLKHVRFSPYFTHPLSNIPETSHHPRNTSKSTCTDPIPYRHHTIHPQIHPSTTFPIPFSPPQFFSPHQIPSSSQIDSSMNKGFWIVVGGINQSSINPIGTHSKIPFPSIPPSLFHPAFPYYLPPSLLLPSPLIKTHVIPH